MVSINFLNGTIAVKTSTGFSLGLTDNIYTVCWKKGSSGCFWLLIWVNAKPLELLLISGVICNQ
jgi:hypothetical protein